MELINPQTGAPLTESAAGFTDPAGRLFPLREGVVCLADDDGYAGSFGYQWERFARTQLDSEASRERFFASSGWNAADLAGVRVLEVGCGAGRFTKVLLEDTRAEIYSVDYSQAVWVNRRNHPAPAPRLRLFHASVYQLPFRARSFERVFCFGVLQHTPDFRRSLRCLAEMVAPGGALAVDFYPIRGWWTKLHAKYLLRPLTRRLPHHWLLRLIEANVDWLLAASEGLHRLRLGALTRFLPLCDVRGTLPEGLSPAELREWAVLDTFDMFSPAHDHPQRVATVARWLREAGLAVTFAGYVNRSAVVRAVRPLEPLPAARENAGS